MIQRSKPIRRTPLKRSTKPIARSKPKAKRTKPRRGQPTPAEKTAIRDQVYDESGGHCQLNLSPHCRPHILPRGGDVFTRWHLVHLKAKRVHGWGRENLRGGCYECHIIEMHTKGKKP
jgi:hypothetical protein